MKCAFCQRDIPAAGNRFCPSCGAPVATAAAPAPQPVPGPVASPAPTPAWATAPAQAAKKGPSPWLFGCLGAGALVVLCVVAFAAGDVKDPVVPGDGIDTLVEEIKKIDNAALIAAAKP